MRCIPTSMFPALVCAFLLTPLVASAVVVDLTSPGATGSIGEAHFVQGVGEETGTLEPFLRIQKDGVERGLNSDGPYTMGETPGSWTRPIPVASFGLRDLDGASAIRILLEINENAHQPLLSLDQLMIYTAPLGSYHTLAQLGANGTLIYDMGAGNVVLLNDALEASGASDMTLHLPYRLFAPHQDEFLYLYCKFGASGRWYTSDGGFEQWSAAADFPSVGACCGSDAFCEVLPEVECMAQGGAYLGTMSTCEPDACRPPAAACCWPDGHCRLLTESECLAEGGGYSGEEWCDPNPCQVVPIQDRSWGEIKNAYRR